jgi:hypothetical protein
MESLIDEEANYCKNDQRKQCNATLKERPIKFCYCFFFLLTSYQSITDMVSLTRYVVSAVSGYRLIDGRPSNVSKREFYRRWSDKANGMKSERSVSWGVLAEVENLISAAEVELVTDAQ